MLWLLSSPLLSSPLLSSPPLLNPKNIWSSPQPKSLSLKAFNTSLLRAVPSSSALFRGQRAPVNPNVWFPLFFISFPPSPLGELWMNKKKKKKQVKSLFLQFICTAFSLPSLVETQVGMCINSFPPLVTSAEITHAPLNTLRCFMLVRHVSLSSYLVSAVKHL